MSQKGALFTPAIFAAPDYIDDKNVLEIFRTLLEARSSEEYLTNIVLLANLNLKTTILDFNGFSNKELLALTNFFKKERFIYITRAIYYYKLFPEKLFDEKIHSEKIMSVKSRLNLLYEFIEQFHKVLSKIILERHLSELPDDLLHNEDLPKGIEIDCTHEDRLSILSALRLWRLGLAYQCDTELDELNDRYLKNIFRAYKFWFNPNRLIDAVMILKLRINTFCQENAVNEFNEVNEIFYEGVLSQFKKQSTAECLDLYGYFANNDTCYLMRTLLALKEKITLPWFETDKNILMTIEEVYNALEIVMNALRDELNLRHIKTQSYKRKLPKDLIKPGRRNKDAITRLVSIYKKVDVRNHDKINELFKLLAFD